MKNMYRLAFDLTDYGCGDLIPIYPDHLQTVWLSVQDLVQHYTPEVCCYYVSAQKQLLLDEFTAYPLATDQWITRVLINIALQGQLGNQLPDCIDLEE
jgi:hypothetical protein